jgi:hypothetical protein
MRPFALKETHVMKDCTYLPTSDPVLLSEFSDGDPIPEANFL